MQKLKIYVVTHQLLDYKLPANYEFIQVNAKNNEHFATLTDDNGDNISTKNPYYCELTAHYYVWKNDKVNDIVGFVHYRRYLTSNKFSSKQKYFLNYKRITKDLSKYDLITTKPYKTNETIKEHLLRDVHEKDYEILRNVIAKDFPNYLAAFDKVMAGHESYLLNMFITTKEKFASYCNWLFSLLFKVEEQVDMTGYSTREQRLYGFLAERLLMVYTMTNNLKVKSYPTYLLGRNKLGIAIDKIKRIVLKK